MLSCTNCRRSWQGTPNVTPRSVPIPKSHWLTDSLAPASGRRTPDGPHRPVTTAPCLRSLTVGVGIKQGEILGRTEQYKHAHSIYTVHDVIQEVISYIMFPVRYSGSILKDVCTAKPHMIQYITYAIATNVGKRYINPLKPFTVLEHRELHVLRTQRHVH